VKIDNLKAAILEASFYEPFYQKEYLEFSRAYGFLIHNCKVRYPEEKGKVESGVKYVKGNFFAGREAKNHQDSIRQLHEWQENVCNARLHGTTKKVPSHVFEQEEKKALIALPLQRWETYVIEKRKVSTTCHILVDGNYYSVPYRHVGKEVEVRISEKFITIYHELSLVALHLRLFTKGEYKTENAHYPEYKVKDQTLLQYEKKQKMEAIGNEAMLFYTKILSIHPESWNRRIAGIIQLSKTYGSEAVNRACQRAMKFDVYTYQAVKKICQSKLYQEPIEHLPKKGGPQIRESPIGRPMTYYAHIFLSSLFICILWNLLQNLLS
jgi:hypothetical protein